MTELVMSSHIATFINWSVANRNGCPREASPGTDFLRHPPLDLQATGVDNNNKKNNNNNNSSSSSSSSNSNNAIPMTNRSIKGRKRSRTHTNSHLDNRSRRMSRSDVNKPIKKSQPTRYVERRSRQGRERQMFTLYRAGLKPRHSPLDFLGTFIITEWARLRSFSLRQLPVQIRNLASDMTCRKLYVASSVRWSLPGSKTEDV